MQEVIMVRSRLRDVVKVRNIERLQQDEPIYSVRSLAESAGVAASTVQALMSNAAKRVDMDTLSKLCATLHCTPGDLLEYIPDDVDGTE